MNRIRSRFALLSVVALFGGTFAALQLVVEPAQRVRTAAGRSPSREQIESDLQLRLELHPTSATINAGDSPRTHAILVNTSTTRTHRVVKPGHGSEIASREPSVYWTTTLDRGDKNETPVPKERVGYCGTCLAFASMWEKDWIVLKPGQRLELGVSPNYEFQQVGRVRLQAHYDFRGDRGSTGFLSSEELGNFARVPAFALSSNTIEFNVARPLDVRVRVKGALKANQKTKLSDLLDITLVNQSNESVTCSMPTLYSPGGRLFLEIKGEFGGWRPDISEEREVYAREEVVLKPGETVRLLGTGEFANGIDGWWEYPRTETVRLRAGFMPQARTHAPPVLSEWVEMKVEK